MLNQVLAHRGAAPTTQVKRTCLASSIKAKHQKTHFLRSKDLAHDFGDLTAHLDNKCDGYVPKDQAGEGCGGRSNKRGGNNVMQAVMVELSALAR